MYKRQGRGLEGALLVMAVMRMHGAGRRRAQRQDESTHEPRERHCRENTQRGDDTDGYAFVGFFLLNASCGTEMSSRQGCNPLQHAS